MVPPLFFVSPVRFPLASAGGRILAAAESCVSPAATVSEAAGAGATVAAPTLSAARALSDGAGSFIEHPPNTSAANSDDDVINFIVQAPV